MADVYLGATRGPGGFSKLLVVKVLHADLARSSEFLGMFHDEARLAARLNHPSIVQTYEVGESDGKHFITMEYVEGQPLYRVVQKFHEAGKLTLDMVLRIGIDALDGLHYAHEFCDLNGRHLGVVHRDITPQNVLLSYQGQVKLVDFGIAKAFDRTTHTKVGTVKGKVSYMAPEQARGESVDRTADIFSMGVLLWEMLAGTRLWEGLTDIAVVGRLVHGDIPNLHSIRPDLPASLNALIMQALDPAPERRPPTALEFQRALQGEFDASKCRLTAHDLGELMREEFQEQRAKVHGVVSKQLERMLREPPNNSSFSTSLRVDMSARGNVPLLGEGSSVHDAPTTIHTGFTDELMAAERSEQHAILTPAAVVADRPAPPRSQRFAWPVLAAVGVAGVAAGVVQPWKYITRASSEGPDSIRAVGESLESGRTPTPSSDFKTSCDAKGKPLVELTGEISEDATLTCGNDYLLRFATYVSPGTTLTIQAGTRIRGDFETKGTLVVQPGARIEARGTPNAPIVFTSASDTGSPGDWGGLILLGDAPINLKDSAGQALRGRIEGITRGGEYGGQNPNDTSGVLSYVRIEYAGTELAPNNEINGLTLGGVGRGTVIDHVQVRHPADDCFEFFGGTVDAKYLACQHPDDDAFDWDYGYQGRLQFLVAQSDPKVSNGSNGFEGDNDPGGSENTPVSSPTIYNVTMCGKNRRLESAEHFGLLLRRSAQVRLRNAIFMGFGAGLDVRDQNTKLNLSASVFFQNLVYNLAFPETSSPGQNNRLFQDDDHGFDELTYLQNPGRRIYETDPGLGNCFDPEAPGFKPRDALVSEAAIPPLDGFFDSTAQYVGAFRDRSDDWDKGRWLIWTD